MTTFYVGPNRGGQTNGHTSFYTLCNAYGYMLPQDGDTILVDAGDYVGDPIYLQAALTFRAVGGRVRLFYKDDTVHPPSGLALTYTAALMDVATAESVAEEDKPAARLKRVDIYGVDFIGAGDSLRNPGDHTYKSGLRFKSGQLHLWNCRFYNCTNGVETINETVPTSELHMHNCEIGGCGGPGDGYAHNLYVGKIRKLVMEGCYSHNVRCGHLVKSRAQEAHLFYNRFTDEDGFASNQIDFPNGGLVIVVGNLIQKGLPANAKCVGYGIEGYIGADNATPYPINEFYFVNNTLVCEENPVPGNPPIYITLIENAAVTNRKIMNNVAYGVSGIAQWPTTTGYTNNFDLVVGDMPGMADYDFRLTTANGWGSTYLAQAPGSAYGISLTPAKQYVHRCKTEVVSGSYLPGGTQARRSDALVPAWRSAMADRTWSNPGSNTLADVNPENDPAINPNYPASAPWHGVSGQQTVVDSWSGADWDEVTWTLKLCGGGHADYAGNEFYQWDGETAAFSRLSKPTGAIGNTGTLADGQDSSGIYFDGQPRSVHTYNNFANRNGVTWLFGGAVFQSGNGAGRPSYWNGTSWVQDSAAYSEASTGAFCYDSLRDIFWIYKGGGTAIAYSYSPTTHAKTSYPLYLYSSTYSNMLHDPLRDILVLLGASLHICVCSEMAAGTAYADPPISGTPPNFSGYGDGTLTTANAGLAYDEINDRYLIWNGGSSIYVLTPPAVGSNYKTAAWTWSVINPAAGNTVTPSGPSQVGTFSRFWYSPTLRCCGVVNSVSQKMYVFALDT